jgi:hypothetical protein
MAVRAHNILKCVSGVLVVLAIRVESVEMDVFQNCFLVETGVIYLESDVRR